MITKPVVAIKCVLLPYLYVNTNYYFIFPSDEYCKAGRHKNAVGMVKTFEIIGAISNGVRYLTYSRNGQHWGIVYVV